VAPVALRASGLRAANYQCGAFQPTLRSLASHPYKLSGLSEKLCSTSLARLLRASCKP
jgi:hypothetical protein